MQNRPVLPLFVEFCSYLSNQPDWSERWAPLQEQATFFLQNQIKADDTNIQARKDLATAQQNLRAAEIEVDNLTIKLENYYDNNAFNRANWAGVIVVPSANTKVPSYWIARALERFKSQYSMYDKRITKKGFRSYNITWDGCIIRVETTYKSGCKCAQTYNANIFIF